MGAVTGTGTEGGGDVTTGGVIVACATTTGAAAGITVAAEVGVGAGAAGEAARVGAVGVGAVGLVATATEIPPPPPSLKTLPDAAADSPLIALGESAIVGTTAARTSTPELIAPDTPVDGVATAAAVLPLTPRTRVTLSAWTEPELG